MRILTLAAVIVVLCPDGPIVRADERVADGVPITEIPDPVDLVVPVPGGRERVFVQTPAQQPENRPIILIFHGAYYDEHWDNPNDSLQEELRALMTEAARRGWDVVSLNGGEAKLVGTYAGPELHQRTTAVLERMDELYTIDRNRIYTLGYSMGGADAVNYAARHVDPERYMIAAVWCWSGALSANVSEVSCHLVPCNPLARIAASVVQTSCAEDGSPTGEFVTNESLAWNLEHIATTTTVATRDIVHVTCASAALQSLTKQWKYPKRHRHLADHGRTHNDTSIWNPSDMCDFFDGRSVTLPKSATRTVTVEDTRYFYFDVTRTNEELPGVFGWEFDKQTLSLNAVENLATLKLDVDGGVDAPINSRGDLKIDIASADAGHTDIVLNEFSGGPPVSVSRNGNKYTDASAGVWAWESESSSLTLFGQSDTEKVSWVIDAQ